MSKEKIKALHDYIDSASIVFNSIDSISGLEEVAGTSLDNAHGSLK